MEEGRRDRPRVGAKAGRSHRDVGQLRASTAQEIVANPQTCVLWRPDDRETRIHGTLYRDPETRVVVKTTARLVTSKADAPPLSNPIDLGVLHGLTVDKVRFTLLGASEVHSFLNSRITADVLLIGGHFPVDMKFRSVTVCIEELHRLFADRDPFKIKAYRNETRLPAETVGAAQVSPVWSAAESEFHIETGLFGFRVDASRQRPMQWWLEMWVNPLQVITAVCCRLPVRLASVSFNVRDPDHPVREASIYAIGPNWPTMDLSLLSPGERDWDKRALLRWGDGSFRLSRMMTGSRRMIRDSPVVLSEYFGANSIGGREAMSVHQVTHQFLSLVQALESSHTAREGRFPDDKALVRHDNSIDRLKTSLSGDGYSKPDVDLVVRGLKATRPAPTLAQRIREIAEESRIDPPRCRAPWLEKDPRRFKTSTWADWIATARNDLAHGNQQVDTRWLRSQSRYLNRLVEFELLRGLGLSLVVCRDAAASRSD